MKHVFDIAGFKKYLLTEENRFRIDGLSIWYNSIPIPVDLFDIFFESWPDLFKCYLDHLMAALILEEAYRLKYPSEFSFSQLPDPDLIKIMEIEFRQNMSTVITENKNFSKTAKKMAKTLSVEQYELDITTLLECASVKGKKYSRLYLPREFREEICRSLPAALKGIAISNGDMFGNILADKLNLYRSGFSDALAGLFNKLLDYKSRECSGLIKSQNSVTLNFDNKGGDNYAQFTEQKTTDGSLWEPYFDGEIKIKLNPNHPHFSSISNCSNPEAVLKILSVMARLEMNCENEKELKTLEAVRSSISRALWIEN